MGMAVIEISYIGKMTSSGLSLDILKMESWTHMGRTANIIIKDVIHIFASISKIIRILLMGRRNRERWYLYRIGAQYILNPNICSKIAV